VLNEILAKLDQNEKLIGGGAALSVIGWVLGLVLVGGGLYGASNAQALDLGAAVVGVIAIVILYLTYAPNTNITWPQPVPVIQLVLGVLAAVGGVLGVLMAFTYDPFGGLGAYCSSALGNLCPSKPILLFVVAIAVLVGGAAQAYGAYMNWNAKKA